MPAPDSLACSQYPPFRTHGVVPAPVASMLDPPLAAYSIVMGLLFTWIVDLSRNPQAKASVNATRKRA
jgi:hypothetical protein